MAGGGREGREEGEEGRRPLRRRRRRRWRGRARDRAGRAAATGRPLVAVLEKEQGVARHQTGRNSGVIHSGIYYRPGSLKATTAVAGRLAMEQFCRDHGVRYERCGKVIVAVDPRAAAPRRARGAGRCQRRTCRTPRRAGLSEHEPAVRGVAGLHVPDTGIVDFAEVAEALARELRDGARRSISARAPRRCTSGR